MQYYLPDSLDYIDPGFNVWTGERQGYRVRGRTDRFVHQVLGFSPCSGLLLSYALFNSNRFTEAARVRLLREGIRRFYHLPAEMRIIGDCGAYAHKQGDALALEASDVERLLDFYEAGGVDYAVAPDLAVMVLGVRPTRHRPLDVARARARQQATLMQAADYWRRHHGRRLRAEAMGVAQGWDVASYLDAVRLLEQIGYRYIALGGLASVPSGDVRLVVRAVGATRRAGTRLHLLGVSRLDDLQAYARWGVVSFDSTMPVRQAFKDDQHNYHAPGGAYLAIRLPEVRGSLRLRRRLESQGIPFRQARRLEDAALQALQRYEQGETGLDETLGAIEAFEALLGPRDHRAAYARLLHDRPWEQCPCAVCRQHGVATLLFRTAEHNKRRAFHNLYVLHQVLQQTFPA